MKTAEQIAGSHSLSSCARCDCALGNGGVCKRLVGMIKDARRGLLEQAAIKAENYNFHGMAATIRSLAKLNEFAP